MNMGKPLPKMTNDKSANKDKILSERFEIGLRILKLLFKKSMKIWNKSDINTIFCTHALIVYISNINWNGTGRAQQGRGLLIFASPTIF